MKAQQPFIFLTLCASLLSCATPVPAPRARLAVELLQGFPASLEAPLAIQTSEGEHVVLLIDATASMQAVDEAFSFSQTRAHAATAAAKRLLDSLGAKHSVDVWTLGASEAKCAPAWRGMSFDDAERMARAGEGSLADALDNIAAQLETERFEGQSGDLASRSQRRARVAAFTDLSSECGGDLCSAASHLVEVGAQLELTLFGEASAPPCLANLQLGEPFPPPMRVEDRRPGPARFWVEAVHEEDPKGEGILALGRTDGASRSVLGGPAYVYVELDGPVRFGPIDLAPNTETLLRILDFPGLVPAVREWSWNTRDIAPVQAPAAPSAP